MTKLQEQALRKGTQIAVYEIKEVLGRNTSEIFYRAWNEHLNTTVILKEFFPFDFVVRDEEDQSVRGNSKKDMAVFDFGVNNFLQQYEKLLAVQHPGIQNAHNILEFNHTAYLALDDEQGDLLSDLLEKSRTFTEEELRIILTGILRALQECHEVGIVHGDIHPENIRIRKNGLPVLLNFASARQKFARHVKMLPFELHKGGYATPEQYEKEGYEHASVDLHGLGATMYRCIFKKDPGPAVKGEESSNQNSSDSHDSIVEQAANNYSEAFLQIVEWMLKPDVKSRPQSVTEVLTELNKDNKNLKALAVAYPDKTEVLANQSSESESEKSNGFIVALLSLAIIAVGVSIFWTIQNKNSAIVSEQEKLVSKEEGNKSGETESLTPKPAVHNDVAVISPDIADQNESTGSVEILENQTETSVAAVAEKALENKDTQENGADAGEDEKQKTKLASTQILGSDQKSGIQTQDQMLIDEKTQHPESKDADVENEISKNQNSETGLSDNKNDLIDQYMKKAGKSFAKYHLTTPIDDNAYNYYLAVLKIAPNHVGAQNGLRMIVDLYVRLINKAIRKKDYDLARLYLSRAKNILPDSSKLQKKTDELLSHYGGAAGTE